MKKSIVGIAGGAIALSLVASPAVYADESTPADAPYQEVVEDVVDTLPQEPVVELLPDDTAPTLPNTYRSPMTPAEPTTEPSVASDDEASDQPRDNKSVVSAQKVATASYIAKKRLPVALGATFTPRSIQRSRIWSSKTATPSLKTTMYASTQLTPEETTSIDGRAKTGIVAGLSLISIGALAGLRRKRHA